MSKIKLLSIGIIGLLLLNFGLLAFLFLRKAPEHPRPGPRGEGPKNLIIERLNFDKEQVAQYQTLIDAHQDSVRSIDREIRDTKNALYETLVDSEPGIKDSLQQSLSSLHQRIENVHYNHFSDIKKLCKPEQQEDFEELASDLARLFAPGRGMPPPQERDKGQGTRD